MKTLVSLNEKIIRRERIDLAGQFGTFVGLTLFMLFAALSMITGYLILISQGFNLFFFASAALLMAGLAVVSSLVGRSIGSAYIKGDMLIVRYLFRKPKVTELRTVRGVRTIDIFGIRSTSIRYRIDGSQHKVFIFGNTDIQSPKTIIDTARKVA
jgi:hypothetical protein